MPVYLYGQLNTARQFRLLFVQPPAQIAAMVLKAFFPLLQQNYHHHQRQIGGLCLAAHIDRPAYSLLVQLGFIPNDMGLQGVEISRNSLAELEQLKLKRLSGNLPYVTNSDAHRMLEFLEGPKNKITIEEATISELKLALAGKDGRSWFPGYFINDLKY